MGKIKQPTRWGGSAFSSPQSLIHVHSPFQSTRMPLDWPDMSSSQASQALRLQCAVYTLVEASRLHELSMSDREFDADLLLVVWTRRQATATISSPQTLNHGHTVVQTTGRPLHWLNMSSS